MYTITTSIMASCLVLMLCYFCGFVDGTIIDILVLRDLVFVPFLCAAAVGSLIGLVIAKLVGRLMPRIAEVTETFQLSFMRGDDLAGAFYCVATDTTNGKNAFHLYAVSDNNLKLVKSLWQNDSTLVLEDDSLEDAGIWKKTRLVPDPSSPLYRWALAQPKALRNELHLPPAMVHS